MIKEQPKKLHTQPLGESEGNQGCARSAWLTWHALDTVFYDGHNFFLGVIDFLNDSLVLRDFNRTGIISLYNHQQLHKDVLTAAK